MMKIFFEPKVIFIVLLVAVCQLLTTYCAKQGYPGQSFHNIQSQAENKRLKDFMAAGTEKVINTHNTTPDEIIKTARQYLGVPYCMGGTTMKCLDCSGLLVAAFARHGIQLPHNSEELARYGKIISRMDDLRKGDLVFFIRSYKTHYFITHSGIYIGNNEFIHTSSKAGVTITSITNPYWNEKFLFGTRIFD
jgi:murein DD-endopeptidase / murein LD-carboxypeptidase